MCEVYVEKYGRWDYCGLPGYKRDYGGGPHVWPGHDVCHMHRKMSLDDILWRRDRALIHNIGEFVEHLGIINFEWQLCQIWEHWNGSHLASMKRDGRDEFWEMTFAEALERECADGINGTPRFLSGVTLRNLAEKMNQMTPVLGHDD